MQYTLYAGIQLVPTTKEPILHPDCKKKKLGYDIVWGWEGGGWRANQKIRAKLNLWFRYVERQNRYSSYLYLFIYLLIYLFTFSKSFSSAFAFKRNLIFFKCYLGTVWNLNLLPSHNYNPINNVYTTICVLTVSAYWKGKMGMGPEVFCCRLLWLPPPPRQLGQRKGSCPSPFSWSSH